VTLMALDLPPLSEISNSTVSSSLSERKPCSPIYSQSLHVTHTSVRPNSTHLCVDGRLVHKDVVAAVRRRDEAI